eukprot:CAMPEP_0171253870 /NCGR_PEP_ID=MMETSP0790-20130122/51928_1 /TAXON_ID=2925 /ORGANISM="Alexandrium catenella, Strain OF101" /LENGTH=45 /DNA_ID= /DNA_START= /DNA_END= /DNA_ORIENTATION=
MAMCFSAWSALTACRWASDKFERAPVLQASISSSMLCRSLWRSIS